MKKSKNRSYSKKQKTLPILLPDSPILIPDDSMLEGRPMPEDMRCPKCGSSMVEQWLKGLGALMGSPLRVRCTKCNYRNSWYGHIGEMLFMVDELPQGAYARYETAVVKEKYPSRKRKRRS